MVKINKYILYDFHDSIAAFFNWTFSFSTSNIKYELRSLEDVLFTKL